jgi:hypothetical protein
MFFFARALHLKSGLAWAGRRRLLAVEALRSHVALRGWEVTAVRPQDESTPPAACCWRRIPRPDFQVFPRCSRVGLDPFEVG